MKNTSFPRFVLLLIMALSINITLHSQSTKIISILVDSKPVLAEVSSEGKILRVIGDELPVEEIKKQVAPTIIDIKPTVAVEPVKVVKPSTEVIKKETVKVSPTKSEDGVVSFDSGFATLDDKAIAAIDKVIKKLKQEPKLLVVLRTLSMSDDSLLSNNRLNSVRTYLKIRGIDPERVSTETLKGDKDIDEVKIHFVQ